MAGLITVRLSRNDAQPWGFRLQGGKDFGAPLLIQKVNGGSIAEKAGLQVADAVIKVNGQDVYNLRHKDAQDTIVKAGNSFEVVVSRGPGGTWKPNVTPVGNIPTPSPVGGAPAPVTKTSLAYKGPASPAIGSGHNLAARPFAPSPQGSVKSITSKQYNNPVGLYSEQTIAETLSAQAEVLAGGVLGVNFMKNEKAYTANNSEVLKAVQEIDAEPRTPEPVEPVTPIGGVGAAPPPPISNFGLRHVTAPETKPPSTSSPQPPLQPGQNICADCERLIIGVFVRIKDKNLHVECFKCATCGTSLKNVGYYNINNKLYCDVHAKLVARSNPPAPNLDPITIPPGGPIPSGAMAAPLSSSKPLSPQPGTMAPLPFHPPTSNNTSGPKPFGGPAPAPAHTPFSTPAAPAPFTPAPASFTPAPAPFTPAPAPFSAAPAPPAHAPFSSAPPPPPISSFPKNLPAGQIDPSFTSSRTSHEDTTCTLDRSKRMSVCSTEVSALSEKKAKMKTTEALEEDPIRASPIPFNASDVSNEAFCSRAVGAVKQSENYETSEQGNVHITRKSKVEESFVRSQKMYTAEISSSGQTSERIRAASPELEQIMAKKQISQVYHDSARLTPNSLMMKQNKAQSERCLTPDMENLMEKPHGSWSPMPAACFVRPISPSQIVSYPPDIPQMPTIAPQPRTATPEQFQEARETVERFVDHTKQVKKSYSSTAQNIQSDMQQSSFAAYTQQYTPRYDTTGGFSQYQGNNKNVNIETTNECHSGYYQAAGGHTNTCNAQNIGNGIPKNNGSGNSQNNGNGNPQNNGNGNPQNNADGNPRYHTNGRQEDEPKVTEPDENDEKYSRKSSRTDHSQKSSRKTSTSEEESSRRVFTDFGGPQIISSVDVESTTEGGVQTTSVRKSEKSNYASCEFESSRKSFIKQNSDKEASTSNEERKSSNVKFSAGDAPNDEEEMVTKSQVEKIIKQELNKVFHMAQTMEQTNFGEMYDHKSQQMHSSEVSVKSSKDKYEQRPCGTQDKTPIAAEPITKTGKLTSGLTIAPDRPFTPQALESNYPLPYQNIPSDYPPAKPHPQEPPSKPAYIPLSGNRDSPMIHALTIAPDRPYSPLPIATSAETPSFITQSKSKKSSMLDALTTAPSTPFHIEGCSSTVSIEKSDKVKSSETELRYETSQKYAPRPTNSDFKPITTSKAESKASTTNLTATKKSENYSVASFPPVTQELKSAFKGTSKVQSSSFVESERVQSETSKQTLQASHQRVERPITPSGLHPPNLLPYYQQYIGEIPLAHRANSPVPHQIKAPSITPPRAPSVTRQGERRGSVKALSDAYTQQIAAQKQQESAGSSMSSVSYVSSGAFSSGSVTKAYSYEQEHKSIDPVGYHASPLAGKLPLAGEQNLPKCSSPVLGKLDHTKQVFKPSIPAQPTGRSFQSPIAEQANLRPAAPYFVQEKEKAQAPWVVVKEKNYEESVNISSFKSSQPTQPTYSTPASQNTVKPFLPPLPLPIVNKNQPSKPFSLPGLTKLPSAIPDAGPGGGPKGGTTAGTTAPRRGRGVLNTAVSAGGRVPLCGSCNSQIRGPFITALGKIWCPEHFVCVNGQCRRQLQDIGFVEDPQGLYCEFCYEQYLAPTCNKCNAKVKGDCLNAIGKHFHPECFTCAYCGKLFGNNPFFLEDALPYCETDWNELFTTKCFSCGFPIEAGDRWVEALNNNYHSQCFNCTMCKKNLEGQSFFAKGGRPFCKNHAR